MRGGRGNGMLYTSKIPGVYLYDSGGVLKRDYYNMFSFDFMDDNRDAKR